MGASGGDPFDSLTAAVFNADLAAVLDAMDSHQVVLMGWGYTGGRALQFPSTHAEKVKALVLLNSYAHYVRHDDYPVGFTSEGLDRFTSLFREGWGTGDTFELLVPSRAADDRFRSWWTRSERLDLEGDQVAEFLLAAFRMDLRPVLSTISIPTLVLHRVGNQYVQLEAGLYLAEHIPGAKFVALVGDEHPFFVGDTDGLVDEIEDFLTGSRQGSEGDVITATVLFTDIVSSTEHLARVGQRAWSQLTDHHDALVRSSLTRNKGHEIKTTGDGFLATFDSTGRAIRCAREIIEGAEGIGLDLRAGLHSGDVEVRGQDIAGMSVTIAKRVCDLAKPGEVLVSDMVRGHVVGSGTEFQDRGEHELKGVPGSWRLFSVLH